MHLNDDPISLYDVLELTPDATPQEIRSAYLRLKSSYNKDNMAHYTLFSREETEQMLEKIENAYVTLSNPERRRSYDQGEGHAMVNEANPFAFQSSPMMSEGMEIHTPDASLSSSMMASTMSPVAHPASAPTSAAFAFGAHSIESNLMSDVDSMIHHEQEWSGASLRRIREARRMSLDDLADYTRISKSYLRAIEEEDYNKLPATVYVRGFLQQMAKRLKLPIEIVIQKYLDRFKTARPDKA